MALNTYLRYDQTYKSQNLVFRAFTLNGRGIVQMTINVGDVDRMFRILLGLLFIGLALALGGAWWFGLIGIFPVFTGVTGKCPGYAAFGVSTCN